MNHTHKFRAILCTGTFFAAGAVFAQDACTRVVGWGGIVRDSIINQGPVAFVATHPNSQHALAIMADGRVVAWGNNNSSYDAVGAAEVPSDLGAVTQVAVGGNHNIALRQDGTVRCWGYNFYGECNVPAGLGVATQVSAGVAFSVCVTADGMPHAWGSNWDGQSAVPANFGPVLHVSAGPDCTYAVKANGTLGGWGVNTSPGYFPGAPGPYTRVAAGGHYSGVALRQNGTVVAWKQSDPDVEPPEAINDAVGISAGWDNFGAVRADGSIVMWPRNSYGGQTTPPADLGPVTQLVEGYISIALLMDGTLRFWGPTGYGIANVPDVLPLTRVAAVDEFCLGMTPQRTIVGWGWDPGIVQGVANIPANLGPVQDFAVSAMGIGMGHAIAARDDGTAVCWGTNNAGQCNVPLGLTDVRRVSAGESHSIATRTDGAVVCWGSDTYGQCAVPIDLPPVEQVSAGMRSSLVVTRQGLVRVWGSMAPPPADLGVVLQVAGGKYHAASIRADGTVRCWGNNLNGEVNTPEDLGAVRQVAASDHHTVALKTDGTVAVWGSNHGGERNLPVGLSNVRWISVGMHPMSGSSTIMVLRDPLPACAPDLNHDGEVDGGDLGSLLGWWGATGVNAADLNGDGLVDGSDLGALLAAWGACPH